MVAIFIAILGRVFFFGFGVLWVLVLFALWFEFFFGLSDFFFEWHTIGHQWAVGGFLSKFSLASHGVDLLCGVPIVGSIFLGSQNFFLTCARWASWWFLVIFSWWLGFFGTIGDFCAWLSVS